MSGLNAQLAAQFRSQLALAVPARLAARARTVYFGALTEFAVAVDSGTPVDTGYLAASFTASTPDAPAPIRPERAKDAKAGQYFAAIGEAAIQRGTAVGAAVRDLTPVTFGFQATYAPYVELHAHMVVRAKAQWPEIVERAIAAVDALGGGSASEAAD